METSDVSSESSYDRMTHCHPFGPRLRHLTYLELENILHGIEFLLESSIGQISVGLLLKLTDRSGETGVSSHPLSCSPATDDQGPRLSLPRLNGSRIVAAYLAENCSYVSSSCWPERSFMEVLKAGRPKARAAGVCTRVRGN